MDTFSKDDDDIVQFVKDHNINSGSSANADPDDPESKDIEKISARCYRAYAYNDRDNTSMAEKEIAIGDKLITDSLTEKNAPIIKERARIHYEAAIEYLQCNKAALDEKFRILNENNSGNKAMLTADNKAIKRINKYIESKSQSNYKSAQVMLESLMRKTDDMATKGPPSAGNLSAQPSDGSSKSAGAREKLLQSLHKSAREIKDLRLETEQRKARVAFWQNTLNASIDSMRKGITSGDSFIIHEIELRLSNYDSYKKLVKNTRKKILYIKQNLDSLYAHRFYGFIDSIKNNERVITSNLRTMISKLKDETSQIRQDPTLVNKSLINWFNQDADTMVSVYGEIITRYNASLNFWDSILPYFKPIHRVFANQDIAFKFMEKVEKQRFDMTKKHYSLKKKGLVDLNTKNIQAIRARINTVKKLKVEG